jgi:hypothetical protein
VTDYRWFLVQGIDDLGGVVGDLLQRLIGEDVRVRAGLPDSFRIIWPVRGKRRIASLAEQLPPAVPAVGNSQRPWMKTTGVLPEAFAASISRFSRSEIDAMPNSSPDAVISIPDPIHWLFHLDGQPLLLLHPFIPDPISYVDQGCAEVHAASAREVATSAGIRCPTPRLGSTRASATALRSDRLRFRAVLAWLSAYLDGEQTYQDR